MNYTNLVKEIQLAALSQPNVNSFSEGDVYNVWHHTTKYASVVCGLESTQRNDNTITYNVVLYYGDRPTKDDSNKIAIYDDGVNVLQSILDKLPDDVAYQTPITYNPFEQSFEDVIDGCWARISFETEYEYGRCGIDDEDLVEKTIDITENGKKLISGYDYANVNVIDKESIKKLEELEAEIDSDRAVVLTENGGYLYDGMGYNDITVNVPVPRVGSVERTLIDVKDGKTYSIWPTGDVDAMSSVHLTLHFDKVEENVEINSNGLTELNATDGKLMSKVSINVNVPSVETVEMTQAEYDALPEYDNYKIYLITE